MRGQAKNLFIFTFSIKVKCPKHYCTGAPHVRRVLWNAKMNWMEELERGLFDRLVPAQEKKGKRIRTTVNYGKSTFQWWFVFELFSKFRAHTYTRVSTSCCASIERTYWWACIIASEMNAADTCFPPNHRAFKPWTAFFALSIESNLT